MKQIIIDTDPGVDDALAIFLAISSKLNIIGFTTTYGNSNIENTTKNTLSILQILNSKIPVYQGAEQPLIGKPIYAKSHGQNGLGEFSLKNLKRKTENITAVQFFINSLEKNKNKEINIICLGPTTNLALLKIIRPDLISKINQIIILGGVFGESGNITSKAEFNVYNDPKALDIILSLDTKKILIPINICRKVMFDLDDFNQIKNKNLSNKLKKITKGFIDYYKNDPVYGKFKGGVMYDLLTIAYLINPRLFKTENKFILVNQNGQTVIKSKNINNCQLITKVNSLGVKKLFIKSINSKYE